MISVIKRFMQSVPIIGPSLIRVRRKQVKSSADYWERRYKAGGNSGAGSYNRLAEFKAGFLNKFVVEQQIASVIEFGSGDGSQLKLAHYPNYLGIDVSSKAVEMCRKAFAGDAAKIFLLSDELKAGTTADLSLSLDVIYHLIEDSVFDVYMQRLFECARRFVIVYSSNMDQESPATHVRHRRFTRWVDENKPEWLLHSTVRNAYPYDDANSEQTSFADFYIFARA
jgi:hypothetical protein